MKCVLLLESGPCSWRLLGRLGAVVAADIAVLYQLIGNHVARFYRAWLFGPDELDRLAWWCKHPGKFLTVPVAARRFGPVTAGPSSPCDGKKFYSLSSLPRSTSLSRVLILI